MLLRVPHKDWEGSVEGVKEADSVTTGVVETVGLEEGEASAEALRSVEGLALRLLAPVWLPLWLGLEDTLEDLLCAGEAEGRAVMLLKLLLLRVTLLVAETDALRVLLGDKEGRPEMVEEAEGDKEAESERWGVRVPLAQGLELGEAVGDTDAREERLGRGDALLDTEPLATGEAVELLLPLGDPEDSAEAVTVGRTLKEGVEEGEGDPEGFALVLWLSVVLGEGESVPPHSPPEPVASTEALTVVLALELTLALTVELPEREGLGVEELVFLALPLTLEVGEEVRGAEPPVEGEGVVEPVLESVPGEAVEVTLPQAEVEWEGVSLREALADLLALGLLEPLAEGESEADRVPKKVADGEMVGEAVDVRDCGDEMLGVGTLE